MPHQTPLNRDGEGSPSAGVRHGLGGLLHDVTTLAELQFKLLAVDAKEVSGRAILPAALLGAAAVFALSALPLLLLALAQALRDQAGWPAAVATLTAVAVGLAVAGLFGAVGYFRLRRTLEPLARSRDEFNRNMNWLKHALGRQELHKRTEASLPSRAGVSPNHPR